ncbi:MAG: ComF family protein [Bernardetiaceae bacterium]|nr:ComF family protein [Bernardetiaceae bacterium]
MALKQLLHDFTSLLYPVTCVACRQLLEANEALICTHCLVDLPYSHSHRRSESALADKFVGRVPIHQVWSYLYFRKGSRVQRLIHHFKYEKLPEIGYQLACHYAETLKEEAPEKINFDFIIPVPLHPHKKAKRGYNQSEYIGQGLSDVWNIPMLTHALERQTHNDSQTRKNKEDRWQAVSKAFKLNTPDMFADTHVLLVDDVITTGSTLEACASLFMPHKVRTVSVLSLAFLAN